MFTFKKSLSATPGTFQIMYEIILRLLHIRIF